MSSNEYRLTRQTDAVRLKAMELGFDAIGFSRARRLEEEEKKLEQWLREDRHGTMAWMENHFDKRVDPRKLLPGARSVVSLIMSYHWPVRNSEKLQIEPAGEKPLIARYALGEDYHTVFKEKLYQLFAFMESEIGEIAGRVFVDSAPVLDKIWAVESGLGWMGKNSNILNRNWGSWFLIGEIILDAEFIYGKRVADFCGSCTRCIDACPTDAIYEPYRVDGSKCISYFTIELRDAIPEEYHEKLGSWIFGCDICQDVCPWNRRAQSATEKKLSPRTEILHNDWDFWKELDLQEYRRLFRKSAIKRAKYDGIKRNIRIAAANSAARRQDESGHR